MKFEKVASDSAVCLKTQICGVMLKMCCSLSYGIRTQNIPDGELDPDTERTISSLVRPVLSASLAASIGVEG